MENLEFRLTNPPSRAQRVLFPLYSHKIDSDIAGKHDSWPKSAHKPVEIASIGADLAFNTFAPIYLLFRKNNPQAAASAFLLYQSAVVLLPEKVSDIGKPILKQILQSKGKLL